MRLQKVWVLFGVFLLALGLGGLAVERFSLAGLTLNQRMVAFVDGTGVSYAEAQELYRKASEARRNHNSVEAITLYDKIKNPYLRLRPVILIQQAEAYSDQGSESKAQEGLKTVIKDYPNTLFEDIALYRVGQSYMRASQLKEAQSAFDALETKAPDSNLTVGSWYYQGELARKAGNLEEAADHWQRYLIKVPDGTFSSMAAEGLENLPGKLSPDTHEALGRALVEKEDWNDAVIHLEKAPSSSAWLPLGKAYLHASQTQKGRAVLESGLKRAVPREDAEAAILALMGTETADSAKKARLVQLLQTQPTSGGDFVLWQLTKLTEGPERVKFRQMLLDRYPESNWAPETSWALMWPYYQPGDSAKMTAFLTRADNHLKRYPTSHSASKVMFWKGKAFLAAGKQPIARQIFQDVASTFPRSYYAFRSEQILNNVSNPWKTGGANAYPPEVSKRQVAPNAIAHYVEDKTLQPLVEELIRVEAPQDLAALLKACYGDEIPGPVMSVIHLQQGETPQSLRVLKDYLDEQRKAGRPGASISVSKLFYPVLYDEQIQRYAEQNNLDPYLVQALMRQESYFNPVAVSSSRAMGLMQILPSTAQGVADWEGVSGFQATMLFDPEVNVRFGTRYLRYLHDRFKGNSWMSVGGYNGGPGAMSRWVAASPLANSDPDRFIESIPYDQTRDYIKEVYAHYWNYRQLYE